MVSPNSRTKLTYGDYGKTPEDERWEVIDGESGHGGSTRGAPPVSAGGMGVAVFPGPDFILDDKLVFNDRP